jgi:hypothetical protein
VEIELVEMTKLLGVALDCKRSWSKHIDAVVTKMGRSLSIIMQCSSFLTTLSTRQVLQALVLSHLNYCSVVWSGATKKELGKLQLAQKRAAWPALGCTQRANINNMHVNLSWLITTFIYERLNAPSGLSKLLAHSSDTHAYPSRHATRGLFTVLKSRTDYGRHTVLHGTLMEALMSMTLFFLFSIHLFNWLEGR